MLYLPEKDFQSWSLIVAVTASQWGMSLRHPDPIKITKKLEGSLFAEAQEWLPCYKPCHGDSLATPWGSLRYNFVVWAEQAAKWQLPEFSQGQEYALTAETPRRVSGYPDVYRQVTWDAGYLVGLAKRHERTMLKEKFPVSDVEVLS